MWIAVLPLPLHNLLVHFEGSLLLHRTILWRAGLETDSVLSGRLQVLRIRIGDDGNMIIDFKTTTNFRGKGIGDEVMRYWPIRFVVYVQWCKGISRHPRKSIENLENELHILTVWGKSEVEIMPQIMEKAMDLIRPKEKMVSLLYFVSCSNWVKKFQTGNRQKKRIQDYGNYRRILGEMFGTLDKC